MRSEDDALGPAAVTRAPSGSESQATPNARRNRASVADVPKTLGRYEVLGELGRGGMGEVHEAWDPQLSRTVALKLLHSEPGRRHSERFIREARALARLSHPNVVQVFEVGQHDDRWFIAMERVPGRALSDWQRERPSWRECLRVYLQAGQGLAAAHAAGLTHRDFKPSNCILDEEGRVRVLDFGLAYQDEDRSHESSASEAWPSPHELVASPLTQTGEVLGTLGYMPLEQLSGRRADTRSDQWSFCASLYEALYGQRPIAAESVGALVVELTLERIRPAPRGSRVPRRLRRVLLRGLAKDPEVRWPSMEMLLAALETIKAGRRRWVLGGGVVLAAGLGVGLLASPTPSRVVVPAGPSQVPSLADVDVQPSSPDALELREWAEGAWAAHRHVAIREHLDQLETDGVRPDDLSLTAEVLLWRGRIHLDAQEGAALLRRAYFLAQQEELPSIEARAAASIADNPYGAHGEGVVEWTRLGWVALERVPWDRSAAVELVATVANATAQLWWILGKEYTRAILEFADDTVGEVVLEDDIFVAWNLVVLSNAWREFGEPERALHWGLEARELLGAVVGPEHLLWGDANEHIGRAILEAGPHRCGDALRSLHEALAIYLRHGDGQGASMVRLEIGRCSRELGQPEAGLEHARRAAEHWAEHPSKFMVNRQQALLLAGLALEDLGRVDEARSELEHLLTLVDLDASTDVTRDEAKRVLERLGPGGE